MGRRHIADSETTAIATERLAMLLADLRPRRALPDGADTPDGADAPEVWEAAAAGEDLDGPGGSDSPAGEPSQAGVRERLPARARGFGRRHLGVLAIVVLIGLSAAGWALLRARPVAVATPVAVTTSAVTTSAGTTSAGTTSPGTTSTTSPGGAVSAVSPGPSIQVHVIGAVRRAGVVTLAPGTRVKDAIDAAGGLTGDARPGELNLAQVVEDGEQVVIGTARSPGGEVRDTSTGSGPGGGGSGAGRSGAGDAAGKGAGGPGAGGSSVVNLNSATAAELDALPGVGPVTAERILAWRTEHQRFSRVEELQEVDGIGPKTYAQIAPHVRV